MEDPSENLYVSGFSNHTVNRNNAPDLIPIDGELACLDWIAQMLKSPSSSSAPLYSNPHPEWDVDCSGTLYRYIWIPCASCFVFGVG